jgi:hypothetical protein
MDDEVSTVGCAEIEGPWRDVSGESAPEWRFAASGEGDEGNTGHENRTIERVEPDFVGYPLTLGSFSTPAPPEPAPVQNDEHVSCEFGRAGIEVQFGDSVLKWDLVGYRRCGLMGVIKHCWKVWQFTSSGDSHPGGAVWWEWGVDVLDDWLFYG